MIWHLFTVHLLLPNRPFLFDKSRCACLFVQFLLRMYAQARNQCRDMVFLIRDIFAKGQYLAKGPVSELPSECTTEAFCMESFFPFLYGKLCKNVLDMFFIRVYYIAQVVMLCSYSSISNPRILKWPSRFSYQILCVHLLESAYHFLRWLKE